MEVPTVPSSEVDSKPPKKLFCGCVKMELYAYVLHISNFALLTSFGGLVFLAVVDLLGWFDGKPGTFWYVYLLKISIILILIALGLCLVSLVIVIVIQKHPKCTNIYLGVIMLLNVVAVLIIAVMSVVRLHGPLHDVWTDIRNRLCIYGGWIVGVLGFAGLFLKSVTDEDFERITSNLPA